ncbi:liprin-beta-1 isoform X12 [Lethenteron reissneri]|uniref:liprin-beta-1 isoform X12 n=1 Tax=Lethenteron reissneri TaxID=7753 RepID=UPI002AB6501F|nr:liprin-beta-1 isoform X12 [Lethenteron reissneri]
MSDASEMLAAALEQMDGIIAGSKGMEYGNGLFDCQSPVSPYGGTMSSLGGLRVLQLVEELRGALDTVGGEEDRETLRSQIPDSTVDALADWLHCGMTNGHLQYGGVESYQERLSRLEGDKESLVLQVSVLTDQVEVQGEKIRDLEVCLDEHRDKLNATEDMLEQELLSRTSLETQKLDLMTEISSLKIKLASVERDRSEFMDRSCDGEDFMHEIAELRRRVVELEGEKVHFEKKLKNTKVELDELQELLMQREVEVEGLKDQLVNQMTEQAETVEKDQEIHRLKVAMESLMAANEDKDHMIDDLRQSLTRYRKVQEMVLAAKGKKGSSERLPGSSSDDNLSAEMMNMDAEEFLGEESFGVQKDAAPSADTEPEQPLQIKADDVETVDYPTENGDTQKGEDSDEAVQEMAPQPASRSRDWQSASSPEHAQQDVAEKSVVWERKGREPAELAQRLEVIIQNKALQEEEGGSRLQTLPPSSPSSPSSPALERHLADEGASGGAARKPRASFGRGFFKVKGGKRTASAPNLEVDKDSSGRLSPSELASPPSAPLSPETRKKSRGIKKIFGMLKRSQSTNLNPEEEREEEFRRGGLRATADPRLGWSRDLRGGSSDLDAPFAKWSTDQVCNWLHEQGLGMYVGMARQWVTSGQTMLRATAHDLDKELGIKHSLHKKKLQLALQAMGSEEENSKGELDYNWVTRWLDDIGLPQYKDQFNEGRVDGRMLHYLTVDDLLSLKVTSLLHHLSYKRAIQVLRMNKFHPNCLRRRPSDEGNVTPAEVTQWTNHRVMEWLRSADLAEYAPNLRGSGVHGGLLVLEPRFTVETLALLLNIPPNKTLLRRHLATHFDLLVGPDSRRHKQEALEVPNHIPLTTTAKVKPKKLPLGISGFGSLRRRKQEDAEDYVCPMELCRPGGLASQPGFSAASSYRMQAGGGRSGFQDDDDLDRLEQMEDSEGTVRQIGAFSEGINNLTSMLSDDDMFMEYASTSPNAPHLDNE